MSIYVNYEDEWRHKGETRLGSIVSSTRNGLDTTYLSTLNACILIMVHKVRLMMFLLMMVDYLRSFLSMSNPDKKGGPFLLSEHFCWTPP